MTTPGRLERNGPIAVYAVGAVIILFIAIAAAWMITRDYRIAIEQAELHLETSASCSRSTRVLPCRWRPLISMLVFPGGVLRPDRRNGTRSS